MSWTSSPKDSVFGLTLLLIVGWSLIYAIAGAAWSVVRGDQYEVQPGWLLAGILGFSFGLYAFAYAVNGLCKRLVVAHTRREGPIASARMDTVAVVLAWTAVVSAFVVAWPGEVFLFGFGLAAVFALAAQVYRGWSDKVDA